MENWWLIVIAIIAILIVSKVIHFKHAKHKITAIVIVLILLFILSTAATVVKSNSINIKTPTGMISAGKLYFVWLGQAFTNIKTLTGNAIKMDWMPDINNSQKTTSQNSKTTSNSNTNNNWKIP